MTWHWTLPNLFDGSPDEAVADLQSYFVAHLPDGSGPLYTGAMFERLVAVRPAQKIATPQLT